MERRHLDRLHGELRAERERSKARRDRPVRECDHLHERTLDTTRQHKPWLDMPLGRLEPSRPQLRDAEVDQRDRAQVLVEPERHCVQRLHRREQPLRLLDDGREVAAATGQQQAHQAAPDQEVCAPLRGLGRARCESELPLGLVERPVVHLVGCGRRHELCVGRTATVTVRGSNSRQARRTRDGDF